MSSKTILITLLVLALIGIATIFSGTNTSKNFGTTPISFPNNTPSQDEYSETIEETIVTTTENTSDAQNPYIRQPFSVYTNQSPVFTYFPQTNPQVPQTPTQNTQCPSVQTRALWVWDSDIITNSSNNYSKRSSLLSFASSKNITTLYVESYGIITGNRTVDKTALSEFIRLAHEKCISVELLAGESEWYLPSNHSSAVNFAQKAVDFADSFAVKPKAIHLDVEPYGYSSGSLWDANNGAQRDEILADYISMLSKVKSTLDGTLLLNVDVPFWYDSASGLQDSGTAYFSKRILDTVDIMTIMDYRDTAFGVKSSGEIISSKNDSSNGIYDLGYDEVVYANSIGKKVIIGVETKCFSDSASAQITFCGTRTVGGQTLKKGASFMNSELDKIRNAFNSLSGFGGTAIHHYDSYTILPNSY